MYLTEVNKKQLEGIGYTYEKICSTDDDDTMR